MSQGPLSDAAALVRFRQEFQEAHLNELGFLLGLREYRLQIEAAGWEALEGPEGRILAHLEAMRAEAHPALSCALACLSEDIPEMWCAAGFAMPALAGGLEPVVEAFVESDSAVRVELARGLRHASSPGLAQALSQRLPSLSEDACADALDVLAFRAEGEQVSLIRLLRHPDMRVRAAAARACGALGTREVARALADAAEAPDEAGTEALAAWMLLDPLGAHGPCRKACQSSRASPRLLQRLAALGQAADLEVLETAAIDLDLAPSALAAMGILGAPASIPFLLQKLEPAPTPVRAAIAWALERITGAGLWEERPADTEHSLDEETPALLRWPSEDAARWRAWYRREGHALSRYPRIRGGRPVTRQVLQEELMNPATPVAARAEAFEVLMLQLRAPLRFHPEWFVHLQESALAGTPPTRS